MKTNTIENPSELGPSRANDAALSEYGPEDLYIRLLTETRADKSTLVSRAFFDGGDVLVCAGGRFRFSFNESDGGSVEMTPGDILILYPGNTVTIESLAQGGILRYAIFNGPRVADFFNSFGFYDHLKFATDDQYDTFRTAVGYFEGGNARGALSLLSDALRTFGAYLRLSGRALLFNAITILQRNLSHGIVRLKPVYDEMQVSRSTLHRIFSENGLGGPGEFLRREQYRTARYLLMTTTLPIGEIARRVGIPSSVYFTSFIRRFTGMPPSEFRQSLMTMKPEPVKSRRRGRPQKG